MSLTTTRFTPSSLLRRRTTGSAAGAATATAATAAVSSRRLRTRDILNVVAVVAALAVINVTAHFSQLAAVATTVPVGVAILLVIARANGMTWRDLGLGRHTHGRGLLYGVGAAALVVVAVGIAVALPFTREFFFNESYASLRTALIAALVIIPLQTVLPEELAFRGVLHGTLARMGGTKLVFFGSSLLFGLWHIASSLNLTATNAGLTAFLGSGTAAQWLGVGGAVVATAAAGAGLTWLRHHTGSVIAPIGLHWALNAVGALAAAAAWQLL
ncbi:CPBP family intramembrane glutamic endopeptidase [Corynebacterium sp.]|uniref:CPBP family intramembrane glutamic endopeptidase n=1 Tax=Corynebacterium sp. TaxID=1720 RepID=UPI003B3A376A